MVVSSDFSLCGAVVTVFGGTGFIGSRVVARLLQAGARVRVATRYPQSVYALRVAGSVGQVVAIPCSYETAQDIEQAVIGSDMVVNCTGILYEKRKMSFSHVHTDYPVWMAQACAMHDVAQFVHFSALAVDRSQSEYAVSKLSGERGASAAFPRTTILRPSVVFGKDDAFFNKFAKMAQFLPFLPLFGGGKSKFQPVYVDDVAVAVVKLLSSQRFMGTVIELGGADIVSLKEIYLKVKDYSGVDVCLLPVPWWIARVQAVFLGLLPHPPLTNDQLTSLQTDNVVSSGQLTFADLGVMPTSMDAILPSYLGRYRYVSR